MPDFDFLENICHGFPSVLNEIVEIISGCLKYCTFHSSPLPKKLP